jgi:prepilin-type processing-associated H-X9-DG protein
MWQNMLMPYAKNVQIFVCPDGHPDFRSEPDRGHYGANTNLFNYTTLAAIAAPSETFAVMDSGDATANYSAVTSPSGSWFNYMPGTCGDRDPSGLFYDAWARQDYQGGRHNGGINVTYADGHTKWVAGANLRNNSDPWNIY